MSLSSTKSAGTGADDATFGSIAWSNPGNITASDDSRATASLGASQNSHYLKATNFGFTIPQGSSIDGVLVEWERSQDNAGGGNAQDSRAYLWDGTKNIGDNKATNTNFPTSDAYQSFGGSLDTWNIVAPDTLTVDLINSSGFGALLAAVESGGANPTVARVDHCRITVYYTPAIQNTDWNSIDDVIRHAWHSQYYLEKFHYKEILFQHHPTVVTPLSPPPVTMSLTTTVMVMVNPVPTMELTTVVTVTVDAGSSDVFFQLTTTVVVLTGISINLSGEMASGRYRR